MNTALQRLAAEVDLQSERQMPLRLRFGFACVQRARHLLEAPEAVDALGTLGAFLEGRCDAQTLARVQERMATVARSHPGSGSIDASAHAAVSATYAVFHAVTGHALEAAEYAAYATVYAYGAYALADPDAFAEEFAWQVSEFRALAKGCVVPVGG